MELAGDVTDRAGRPGIALAMTTTYTGAKGRTTLIFDPTTSQLLGEETALLERVYWLDAEPPAVTSYTTYLASATAQTLP